MLSILTFALGYTCNDFEALTCETPSSFLILKAHDIVFKDGTSYALVAGDHTKYDLVTGCKEIGKDVYYTPSGVESTFKDIFWPYLGALVKPTLYLVPQVFSVPVTVTKSFVSEVNGAALLTNMYDVGGPGYSSYTQTICNWVGKWMPGGTTASMTATSITVTRILSKCYVGWKD